MAVQSNSIRCRIISTREYFHNFCVILFILAFNFKDLREIILKTHKTEFVQNAKAVGQNLTAGSQIRRNGLSRIEIFIGSMDLCDWWRIPSAYLQLPWLLKKEN